MNTIPKKDTELKTISEITNRMISINCQIEKAENIRNPRDFDKHHSKITKLNGRKDILHVRRAKLIRSDR